MVRLDPLRIGPESVNGLAVRPGMVAAAGSDSVAVWSTAGVEVERTIAGPFSSLDDLQLTGKNRVQPQETFQGHRRHGGLL